MSRSHSLAWAWTGSTSSTCTTHIEPDLDVVLVVVAGDGSLGTPEGRQEVASGNLVWLPHGAVRALTAGATGLSYLTVHRRRPGLQIKLRPAR
ncbi:hypothetical protein ACIBL3_22400 [Kribbella sp. NPDC050124]|uniref:hypothetical protein n=1 Tax=Kribbella sp. NPDC050124 TaxID=3364114 RepID=UPI00378B3784